jgi:hypothetical protein
MNTSKYKGIEEKQGEREGGIDLSSKTLSNGKE